MFIEFDTGQIENDVRLWFRSPQAALFHKVG